MKLVKDPEPVPQRWVGLRQSSRRTAKSLARRQCCRRNQPKRIDCCRADRFHTRHRHDTPLAALAPSSVRRERIGLAAVPWSVPIRTQSCLTKQCPVRQKRSKFCPFIFATRRNHLRIQNRSVPYLPTQHIQLHCRRASSQARTTRSASLARPQPRPVRASETNTTPARLFPSPPRRPFRRQPRDDPFDRVRQQGGSKVRCTSRSRRRPGGIERMVGVWRMTEKRSSIPNAPIISATRKLPEESLSTPSRTD